MVAALVVVCRPAVIRVLTAVPGVRKRRHGFGLLAVEFHQEILADRAAVSVHAVSVEVQGACKQAFMACHNVCEVSQTLRRVTFPSHLRTFRLWLGALRIYRFRCTLCSCPAKMRQHGGR